MRSSITRWAATSLLLLGGPVLAAGPAKPADTAAKITPKVGKFTVSVRYEFNPIPKSLQLMDFWLPYPIEDPHQKIVQRVTSSPYSLEIKPSDDKLAVVGYMKGAPRGGLPLQVRVTIRVERTEDVETDFSKATEKPTTDEEKQIHEKWVKPDTLIQVDKEMKSIASKIVSGRKKTLDRARAIYDHLVSNVGIVTPYELQGAGYGNAKFTMTQLKGDDMDMASAFVGLCRSIGIPAVTVIGVKVPTGLNEGEINNFHGWAEFYVDGVGWVPVDPAEGRRNVQRRSYYFGSLDERRMAVSKGRDITLIPPQQGPKLNFWIKGYWEGDQKPMNDPIVDIYFQDEDAPAKPGTAVSSLQPGMPPLH
ncbi:MAG TPA: transglutaminase-like domain-containing protein [Patescibacteria group bacterium]|nr:transglutaminase-like domain-containing protein [Patescibacteria group bacterium]